MKPEWRPAETAAETAQPAPPRKEGPSPPAQDGPPRQAGTQPGEARDSVLVVQDPQALAEYASAWEDLAAAALEPNVYFEPWMLQNALKAFGASDNIRVLMVHSPPLGRADPAGKLALLVPLQPTLSFKKLKVIESWLYPHCALGAPLVRGPVARESVARLLDWANTEGGGTSLLGLKRIARGSPLHAIFFQMAAGAGLHPSCTDAASHGLWRRVEGADSDAALPIGLRRRLRHKEQRLNQRGHLRHLALQPGDDIAPWIDDFGRLARNGGAGTDAIPASSHAGTSLLASDQGRQFFEATLEEARRRGRLILLGLDFDGAPMARRCLLTAGDGAVVLETAYEEELAMFSPVELLELHCLRHLHALGLQWMDNGAASPNRLLNDERTVETVVIGSGMDELVVSGPPPQG